MVCARRREADRITSRNVPSIKWPAAIDMTSTLLIMGSSARAAADSAVAAGFRVISVDLFADEDLRRIAAYHRIPSSHYPAGLVEAAAEFSNVDGWLYTGGLENHPAIIASVSQRIPLLGNGANAIVGVRDPWKLSRALAADNIDFPETVDPRCSPPGDGSWLMKGSRSCGGSKVAVWRRAPGSMTSIGSKMSYREGYFQRRVRGVSCSASYVSDGKRAQLLGATRQLLRRWHQSKDLGRFGYAGSLGPLVTAGWLQRWLERVGYSLVERFSLVGLFGVDFVLERNQRQAWVIEVNPRYTASMEVLERAGGISMLAQHVAACRHQRLLGMDTNALMQRVCWKRITYANSPIHVSTAFVEWAMSNEQRTGQSMMVDIPPAKTEIRAGQPAFTLLAQASSPRALLAEMRRLRGRCDERR